MCMLCSTVRAGYYVASLVRLEVSTLSFPPASFPSPVAVSSDSGIHLLRYLRLLHCYHLLRFYLAHFRQYRHHEGRRLPHLHYQMDMTFACPAG